VTDYDSILCKDERPIEPLSFTLAIAVEIDADLLTCDAHFADLPGAVYFAKGAS
jgi:hypothetical protein